MTVESGSWPYSKECLTPDVTTYSFTIKASVDGAEGQLAMQLLHEMPQEWLLPKVVACSFAIKASGDVGEWHFAMKLLRRMSKEGPRRILWNRMWWSGGGA